MKSGEQRRNNQAQSLDQSVHWLKITNGIDALLMIRMCWDNKLIHLAICSRKVK